MADNDFQEMFENFVKRFRSEEKHATQPATPLLELNAPVPDFEAETTHGPIKLSKWQKDKWVILFSHPADFTPVCTTEFLGFAERWDEFQKRNVALLGNSVDSVHSHIAWVRNIKDNFGVEIPFPIIADLDMNVSRKFGMLHHASSDTSAVRAVFVMDPKRILRAMIYYPLDVGRNMDEIVRLVDALQMVDEEGLAAPADWEPGDDAIVPPPKTVGEAEERMSESGLDVTDWYFAKKKPQSSGE
jgi:peroxiredoxin (alkyl hydroperoxide reductase subunit C)